MFQGFCASRWFALLDFTCYMVTLPPADPFGARQWCHEPSLSSATKQVSAKTTQVPHCFAAILHRLLYEIYLKQLTDAFGLNLIIHAWASILFIAYCTGGISQRLQSQLRTAGIIHGAQRRKHTFLRVLAPDL